MDDRHQRKEAGSSEALSIWENEGGGLGPGYPGYFIYLTTEAAFREAAIGETTSLNKK